MHWCNVATFCLLRSVTTSADSFLPPPPPVTSSPRGSASKASFATPIAPGHLSYNCCLSLSVSLTIDIAYQIELDSLPFRHAFALTETIYVKIVRHLLTRCCFEHGINVCDSLTSPSRASKSSGQLVATQFCVSAKIR